MHCICAHLITALKVNNCLNDRTASAEQLAHELLINAIVGNDLIRIISVSHNTGTMLSHVKGFQKAIIFWQR